MSEDLHELTEEQALAAVVLSVRQLFPAVAEHQARELARLVIRGLAQGGVVLARRDPRPAGGDRG